jgi:2-methylcitrate dehydratase PrpD
MKIQDSHFNSISLKWGKFSHDVKSGKVTISNKVLERVRILLADLIGVVLIASTNSDTLKDINNAYSSGLLDEGPYWSALAPSFDLDDFALEVIGSHPGSVIIPTALSLYNKDNESEIDFLKSIVLGYELSISLAKALGPTHLERGFHVTSSVGVIGAAYTASYLLGLSEEETENAIGLAASTSGGLLEYRVSAESLKQFHPCRACMTGIWTAKLAKTGIKGPDTMLEGEFGLLNAYSADPALSELDIPNLSNPKIMGVKIKTMSICADFPSSIHASAKIRKEILSKYGTEFFDMIDKISLERFRIRPTPSLDVNSTRLDIGRSLEYITALALSGYENWLDLNGLKFDPSIYELSSKVEVVKTREMKELLPERAARMTVYMVDKNKYSRYEPQSFPKDPDWEEVVKKLNQLLTKGLASEIINLTKEVGKDKGALTRLINLLRFISNLHFETFSVSTFQGIKRILPNE